MSVNQDGVSDLRSVWIKTAEQQLFHELEDEYGFPRATCRSLVQLMHEFVDQNYGNLRDDSQVIYHAVSKDEPPGRQLDKIKTVPVRFTVSHPDDAEVLEKKGIQGLRQHKLIRFASDAYDQGPSRSGRSRTVANQQPTYYPARYEGTQRTGNRCPYTGLDSRYWSNDIT
jgi:hypothetical protein